MAVLTGIMLSSVFMVIQSSDINIMFPLIKDVMEYQTRVAPPGIAAALLCREGSVSQADETLHLMKYMSTSNIMISSPISWQRFLDRMQGNFKMKTPLIYILDLSCSSSTKVIQEANRKMMFTPRNRWILLMKNDTFPKLDGYAMLLNSDVILVNENSRKQFVLEEVYRLGKELVRRKIGIWKHCCGVTPIAPHVSTSLRRMDMKKSVIKAVMTVTRNETLNRLQNTLEHTDTLSKVNSAVFNIIADIINASVDMTVVNSWGYSNNDTWNGLTGYLQREEADIGTTAMLITKGRLLAISYLPFSMPTTTGFIFRKPPLTTEENIFTLPFSRSTWLAATGLLTFIGILLYIVFRWERKETLRTKEITWSDIILIVIGAVCEQGSTVVAKSTTGRTISILLFATTVYMYTFYSACIVALLQSSTNSIRTLKDLLESNMELGVFDIVYNHYFFSVVKDPVRRAIYTRKVAPPGAPEQFMSMEEGLARVRKGQFAFHVEVGAAYKVVSDTFLEEEKCGLDTMKFLVEYSDPFVPVSKLTPFKEILSVAYLKVRETGLMNREHTRFYGKKPKCNSHDSDFIRVGLLECYPPFLILGCGTIVAIIVLLIEILVTKRTKHFKGRKTQSELFIRRNKMLYVKEKKCIVWDH